MVCREVNRLLPEYSAEALARSQMARVREHLGACEACRLELARLDGVLRLVETHGAKAPPAGLWTAIRARIEAGETPETRRRTTVRGFPWVLPWPTFGGAFGGAWRWASGAALAAGLALAFLVTRPSVPQPGWVMVSDPELLAAVQQHAFASTGQFFADQAGLESIVVLVRKNRETR